MDPIQLFKIGLLAVSLLLKNKYLISLCVLDDLSHIIVGKCLNYDYYFDMHLWQKIVVRLVQLVIGTFMLAVPVTPLIIIVFDNY